MITIHEESAHSFKTLSAFLRMNIPTSRIYLMNASGSSIFQTEKQNLMEFLHRFGKKVSHLRVHKLNDLCVGWECNFYNALSNLTSLEADGFSGGVEAETEAEALQKQKGMPRSCHPSKIFRQLTKLRLSVPPSYLWMNAICTSRRLMDFCEKLEYAGDAYFSGIQVNGLVSDTLTLGLMFSLIKSQVEKSNSLKYYDFGDFHDDPIVNLKVVEFLNAPRFAELALACAAKNVKLLNVKAAWLQKLDKPVLLDMPDTSPASIPVVSMINIHGIAAALNMPNLEKLTISSTKGSFLFPTPDYTMARRPWPKLKILEVNIDSVMLETMVISYDERSDESLCLDAASTGNLMRFLFLGIERPALEWVTLKYDEGTEFERFTVDLVAQLGKCCPNLKKLVLINWPGTNATLQKGLEGLKLLEELSLKRCKLVGDKAFLNSELKSENFDLM